MSNEELVRRAKAGDQDALALLWEQNQGLLHTLFHNLVIKTRDRMTSAGVTWEDVEQCFFLAIAFAVEHYDPERGILFASFLKYSVKTVYFDLIGFRSKRALNEPLTQSSSLDEVMPDGESTRGDLIPAPPDEDIDEAIYTEQLRNELERCLSTLEPQQANAIRCRYFKQLTLAETGKKLGCNAEYVRALENKGMRKLRAPQNIRKLRPYHVLTESAYHGTGLTAWKYAGSVQERTVMMLERKGML